MRSGVEGVHLVQSQTWSVFPHGGLGFMTQLPLKMIPLTVEPAQTLYVHIEAKSRVAVIGVAYYVEVRHTDLTIEPTPAAPVELSDARYVPSLQNPPDPLSD